MAFREAIGRLEGAGLQLHASPTKLGPEAAIVAENVEFYPTNTITKRDGYCRWRDVQELAPVTGLLVMSGRILIMAGELDEY